MNGGLFQMVDDSIARLREMADDAIIRILMTQRILEDALSPMEALAYAIRETGAGTSEIAEIMSRMCGKEITTKAVTVYIARARQKLAENEMLEARGVPEELSE